ncbi:hypothetical protein DFH29DRAFT_1003094 [Suillus ampliporus]|nr:hypothetical protein DFH29DRAFT_1003094 [Suillus ampliporus]
MSVVTSIIHTSPLPANEGIGFTPISLSISFQGSTVQSAQSNFGTIPLQVTILLPREFGGQVVPVICHISWTELVSNFESQSVPQLMIPFLPLPPSFNPLSEASWSMLARQVESWLVDTIRDVRAPEWAWAFLDRLKELGRGCPRSPVKSAEYDSRERQPHPKCLKGTRVDLLNYIHGLLDNQEKSRLIWLHGTAGVGKSAVAFTVAERMRGLKVTEQTNVEKRLAGTFFFSRKYTERCTTGYFFATLVYQLASNFPSIREDVNKSIRDNPALLDHDKSVSFQQDEVRPLVCEIPVKTSGEGIARIISLDGTDVDNDIYIFLRHSFGELQSRHPDFPQPSKDQLERLASRAGRRFIVASTMMKFIDDEDSDPHDRLQLMLKLTSELLPGTEVYKLYDSILSTCANPKRAYLQLSVVAALADPLPMSQISKLLGSGPGRDVETTLMQLRSVMDIPTDDSLPVNIYHLSVRDYVSDPSNCNLPQVHDMPSPHSLLAHSSFRLMMKEIPESTALLDALSELKKQSKAMEPQDTQKLKDSLAFLVRPPEPLSVLIYPEWACLAGDRSRGNLAGDPERARLDYRPGRAMAPPGKAKLDTDQGRLAADPGRPKLVADPGKAKLAADPDLGRTA